MISTDRNIEARYRFDRELFVGQGADADTPLKTLHAIPISIQCWQGDDFPGFENPKGGLAGGIQTTGNHVGHARNAQELRSNLEVAFSLIPGKERVNLHAIYLEADMVVLRQSYRGS